jgi:hypothetical protein
VNEPHGFAVTLVVETADPRLLERALVKAMAAGEPSEVATIMRAILQHLPKYVRVAASSASAREDSRPKGTAPREP